MNISVYVLVNRRYPQHLGVENRFCCFWCALSNLFKPKTFVLGDVSGV